MTIRESLYRFYYTVRPWVPRELTLGLRRVLARRQRAACSDSWPIDASSAKPPEGWSGWPNNKFFAVVLTHDVETSIGHDRCPLLIDLEKEMGFRSSFNFVPEGYAVSPDLRNRLTNLGFEVGVHGLKHDGKLYRSRKIFLQKAHRINWYLNDWGAVGFRSPFMHHNLEWIHDLNIEYDASTFDVDPFEPQPDGVGTIFPFWVSGTKPGQRGYVELPYTLAQDHTLFNILRERGIDCWKRKVAWIAEHGGMVLLNTHPDYMAFGARQRNEYPCAFYTELLDHITKSYEGQYWNAIPREVSTFVRSSSVYRCAIR